MRRAGRITLGRQRTLSTIDGCSIAGIAGTALAPVAMKPVAVNIEAATSPKIGFCMNSSLALNGHLTANGFMRHWWTGAFGR